MRKQKQGLGMLNIAAQTRKREVDNSLSLKIYYRTAENLLRQANVYRNEGNIVDLYILLLRFSSLVSETIPDHRDYDHLYHLERNFYRKKLESVISQLEILKPEVQKEVERINNIERRTFLQSSRPEVRPHGSVEGFHDLSQTVMSRSFSIPRPKEETLAKHSLLGLSSQQSRKSYQPPQLKVQYPSYVDTSVIQIPYPTASNAPTLDPVDSLANSLADLVQTPAQESTPALTTSVTDVVPAFKLIRQPSPPPVAAPVQILPSPFEELNNSLARQLHPSEVADPRPGDPTPLNDRVDESKGPKHLHISAKLMEEFLRMAQQNTRRNLETCGVLAGSLKKSTFYVTALIIPKQEATSDSCQTVNEEEIFDSQDKRGLFQLGWIHTHPSQTCFMSSIDLHTHYSYQIMLPEAIAIVMAPTDSSRDHGIFRLADPGGVKVIQGCQRRGFHHHENPPDGGAIYEHCAHVYLNPKLSFEVIDLRSI